MRIHKIIVTALGSGYAPIAPGTAGSVLGIVLFFIINKSFSVCDLSQLSILYLDLVLILGVMLIGVYSISKIHKIWMHDDARIVIDEVVGVWISALFLPLIWQYYLMAFILFRFFDIVKPLYIRKIDEKLTDWGVMLDDVLAGIYSLIIIQLFIFLFV